MASAETEPKHAIGRLTAEDVPALHQLSQAVRWPHRREDWQLMIDLLGTGLVAYDADQRQNIAGCGMFWPSGPDAGHIGMVIVSPKLQNRGLGGRLMAELLASAGDRRLELNATQGARSLYERDGFVEAGAVRQFQGIAKFQGTTPAGACEPPVGLERPLADGDWPALLVVDRQATGLDRARLLDALREAASLAVVHEVEGRIAGFAFTRPFGHGFVVGPLVAETDAAAIALFRPSLAAHEGSFLRTDTPLAKEANDAGEEAFPLFIDFVGKAGLGKIDPIWDAINMVRGAGAPTSGPARVYCIASQALG